MEKKLQKSCPTGYNSLIVQDLWLTHYKIFLITLLQEFIKLNVKMNMIKTNPKNPIKYKGYGCSLE